MRLTKAKLANMDPCLDGAQLTPRCGRSRRRARSLPRSLPLSSREALPSDSLVPVPEFRVPNSDDQDPREHLKFLNRPRVQEQDTEVSQEQDEVQEEESEQQEEQEEKDAVEEAGRRGAMKKEEG